MTKVVLPPFAVDEREGGRLTVREEGVPTTESKYCICALHIYLNYLHHACAKNDKLVRENERNVPWQI